MLIQTYKLKDAIIDFRDKCGQLDNPRWSIEIKDLVGIISAVSEETNEDLLKENQKAIEAYFEFKESFTEGELNNIQISYLMKIVDSLIKMRFKLV